MAFDKKSVIVVANVTPFVDEAGLVLAEWKLKADAAPPKLDPKRVRYVSFHRDQTLFDYAVANNNNHHLGKWLNGDLKIPGYVYEPEAAPLSAVEIAGIPGAEVVLNKLTQVSFEVCRVVGANIDINADDVRYWASQTEDFSKPFATLQKEHVDKYRSALGMVLSPQSEGGSKGPNKTIN